MDILDHKVILNPIKLFVKGDIHLDRRRFEAGLLTFGKDFELEEAKDIEFMSKLIEQATPLWPPGSTRAYHPLTYGFLVDQLVTRLDPKHRTVAQFYREEIWKTGIDFSIGSEGLNRDSIAKICDPSTSQSVMAHAWRPLRSMVELRYFRFLYTFWKHITSGGLAMTAANYPSFLGIMGKDPIPYNDPAIRALPLVSCMGIGTAAGFAKAVHQVIKIITVMLRNGLRPGDDGMAQFEKISASIFETILEK
ncbi:unnamed protein product [Nippostrongylus brasiliensis]|uniref:Beta-lactamase domain-containing protein n=1 Tax=Nippostrongylus brasiliensis TaxID=27835 RepID=A0A0N4Y220_NIPBR|nr:unnamed protein product [Nippostrongylus brasiliensis]